MFKPNQTTMPEAKTGEAKEADTANGIEQEAAKVLAPLDQAVDDKRLAFLGGIKAFDLPLLEESTDA
jgi:hypothetical protein